MRVIAYVQVLLSLLYQCSAATPRLPVVNNLNLSEISHPLLPAKRPGVSPTNQTATLWPPCPFRVAIPNRRDQYIIVTKNDRKDHGTQAKELAIRVCSQMIDWITKIPHGRRIEKRHWEHESYGLHFATKYSIFMELAPTDPDGDRYSDILNRELAYSAMVELRTLLNQYGAMQGELEFYAVNSKRAIIAIYIFEWPPEMQTGRRVDSRRDSQWDDGG